MDQQRLWVNQKVRLESEVYKRWGKTRLPTQVRNPARAGASVGGRKVVSFSTKLITSTSASMTWGNYFDSSHFWRNPLGRPNFKRNVELLNYFMFLTSNTTQRSPSTGWGSVEGSSKDLGQGAKTGGEAFLGYKRICAPFNAPIVVNCRYVYCDCCLLR